MSLMFLTFRNKIETCNRYNIMDVDPLIKQGFYFSPNTIAIAFYNIVTGDSTLWFILHYYYLMFARAVTVVVHIVLECSGAWRNHIRWKGKFIDVEKNSVKKALVLSHSVTHFFHLMPSFVMNVCLGY